MFLVPLVLNRDCNASFTSQGNPSKSSNNTLRAVILFCLKCIIYFLSYISPYLSIQLCSKAISSALRKVTVAVLTFSLDHVHCKPFSIHYFCICEEITEKENPLIPRYDSRTTEEKQTFEDMCFCTVFKRISNFMMFIKKNCMRN